MDSKYTQTKSSFHVHIRNNAGYSPFCMVFQLSRLNKELTPGRPRSWEVVFVLNKELWVWNGWDDMVVARALIFHEIHDQKRFLRCSSCLVFFIGLGLLTVTGWGSAGMVIPTRDNKMTGLCVVNMR